MQNIGDWYFWFFLLEIIFVYSYGYYYYIKKYVEKEILFLLYLLMWFKKYSLVICVKV